MTRDWYHYCGIDLGGTKTEIAILDRAGVTLWKKRIATPRRYAQLLTAIESLIGQAENEGFSIHRLGIGTPGSINQSTGRIRNSNTQYLNGKKFLIDIEARLLKPVKIANDADCFSLSEAVDGAGADYGTVFGVILGTGCGGGIVRNRKVVSGPSAIAGEWGHMPLPWPNSDEYPGPLCWCGKHGCMETWVSGPAVEHHFLTRFGRKLKASDIAQLALERDKDCVTSLAELSDRLARGLAVAAALIDPDRIVLGGGLSKIQGLSENISEKLPSYLFSDYVGFDIVKNKHGDASGVRGAAWLWREADDGKLA